MPELFLFGLGSAKQPPDPARKVQKTGEDALPDGTSRPGVYIAQGGQMFHYFVFLVLLLAHPGSENSDFGDYCLYQNTEAGIYSTLATGLSTRRKSFIRISTARLICKEILTEPMIL